MVRAFRGLLQEKGYYHTSTTHCMNNKMIYSDCMGMTKFTFLIS
jgi:hypothetical protein